MTIRGLLLFLSLFLSAVSAVRADVLFISSLEADSYRDIIYSVQSFARLADSPQVMDNIRNGLDRFIAIPNRAGIAEDRPIRILNAIDTSAPLSPTNPAPVAILPLRSSESQILSAFSLRYAHDTPLPSGHLFTEPPVTNFPPSVAIAISDRFALVSPSPDILAWAWKNRSQIINAPLQPTPGTFRLLVNAQRFSDLLPFSHPHIALIPNAQKIISDFETITFALTLDGQQAALTIKGKPRDGTFTGKISSAWHPPTDAMWSTLPSNALFASAAGSKPPTYLGAFLPPLYSRIIAPLVPPTAWLSGMSMTYIVPTKNGDGILFARVTKLNDPKAKPAPTNAPPVVANFSLGDLGAVSVSETNGVAFSRLAPRKLASGAPVERYSVDITAAGKDIDNADNAALTLTVLSMFLKKAVMEIAVVNDSLIVATGPDEPLIEQVAPTLKPAAAFSTLDKRLSLEIPALKGSRLVSAATLSPCKLIRCAASVIPGIKPDQLRVLPAGGEQAEAGIAANFDNGEITIGLRIGANEIADLQRVDHEARPLFQEIFFQLFTQQLKDATLKK